MSRALAIELESGVSIEFPDQLAVRYSQRSEPMGPGDLQYPSYRIFHCCLLAALLSGTASMGLQCYEILKQGFFDMPAIKGHSYTSAWVKSCQRTFFDYVMTHTYKRMKPLQDPGS
jgi:hypothetical protein